MKHLKKLFWQQFSLGLLVILLIFINIYLGQNLLALTLFVFSILLTIFKRTNLFTLAFPIAIITLFYTPVLPAVTNLIQITTDLFDKPSATIFNLMNPNTGREVLPRQALQIDELLEEHEITGYQISKNIRYDEPIFQRVIEFTWPITLDPTSPYLFGFTGDLAEMPNCQIIDYRQDIELGYCD